MAAIINKVITDFLFKGIKGGAQSISSLTGAMKALSQQQKAVNDQTRKVGVDIAKNIILRQKAALATKFLSNKNMEIRSVMKVTGLSANQAARAINQLGFTFNKSGRAVDALGKRMKLTRKMMIDMTKTTRRFNMGFLSLMFAAMALNRVVGTFLRNAIGAYAKASGETNNFRKVTNKLTASWEFFKFSLIDALASSAFFALMVQKLTNLVNWFNKLTPATKAWIIMGIGIIFIVSLFVMVIGQIGLAHGGILVLGDLFKWFGTTAGIAVIGIILILIGLGLMILGSREIWRNWGEDWSKVIEGAGIAIIGLGFVVQGVLSIIVARSAKASAAIAASGFAAWAPWTLGISLLVGVIFIAVSKIVRNWDEAKVAIVLFWNAIKARGVQVISSISLAWRKGIHKITNFFRELVIAIVRGFEKIPIIGKAFKGISAGLIAQKKVQDQIFNERIKQIESQRDATLDAIAADSRARVKALGERLAEEKRVNNEINNLQTVNGTGFQQPMFEDSVFDVDYLKEMRENLSNQKTIYPSAPSTSNITTTNIGDVKIDITGGLTDAGDIADQVMDRLNNITNQGLDSTNT